jgi:hypothetical protein
MRIPMFEKDKLENIKGFGYVHVELFRKLMMYQLMYTNFLLSQKSIKEIFETMDDVNKFIETIKYWHMIIINEEYFTDYDNIKIIVYIKNIYNLLKKNNYIKEIKVIDLICKFIDKNI